MDKNDRLLGHMCSSKEVWKMMRKLCTKFSFDDGIYRDIYKVVNLLWYLDTMSYDTLLDELYSRKIIPETNTYTMTKIWACMPENEFPSQQEIEAFVRNQARVFENSIISEMKDWIKDYTYGWFDYGDIDKELEISDKTYRRNICKRLADSGYIERHPTKHGTFRYVGGMFNKKLNINVTSPTPMDVWLPFDLHNYVNIYEGNVLVIAGAPNSGKTTVCLNFIKENMDKFPIYYLCSEMGDEELTSRIQAFGPGLDWSKAEFESCPVTPDMFLHPDCINVIDFVEIVENPFMVGQIMTNISRKIGKGLAIACIQKKHGSDHQFGRGQEFGEEKARLYISLDEGRVKVVKAKSWKNTNPNGQVGHFHIEQSGSEIVIDTPIISTQTSWLV